MAAFKQSAYQYLGISGDQNNLRISGNLTVQGEIIGSTGDTEINGNLTVDGDTTFFGGITGNTQISGNLDIIGNLGMTGNSVVYGTSKTTGTSEIDGTLSLKDGMGVTGTTNFYGSVACRDFLYGVFPYFFMSINLTDPNTLDVPTGLSILYYMDGTTKNQSSSNGLVLTKNSSSDTYIQPNTAGIYEILCWGRCQDTSSDVGIVPYIYAQGDSPASYIASASQPEYALAGDANSRHSFTYTQPYLFSTTTRVDIRAFTTDTTVRLKYASFLMIMRTLT